MRYYIGIDVGTSSTKSILIDADGNILRSASASYSVSEPTPGWREIDPEVWMQAVDTTVCELLTDIDRSLVRSIGVTGQIHTLVLLDQQGRSIRPAFLWNDARTASLIPDMKQRIRALENVSYLADVISTGSPAANLLWFKENEPENYARLHKFLIGPDYIVHRLAGGYRTDYCEASTSSLYDLTARVWSPAIRETFGFSSAIYPEVQGSGEVAGTLLPEFCEKYGLKPDVTVLVGTGDNPAAAIPTGCLAKKRPVMSFGTSGVLMFPRKQPDFNARGKNILFSLDGTDIAVLVQGVVQSCGGTLGWWVEKILGTTDYAAETMGIDPNRLAESPLLFYPHLVGDKTIYADPSLRGCFIGLGTDVTRTDMVAAVLEGICFAVRQLVEAMEIPMAELENLRVIGGGSKNTIWMQILADVLGISVIQMESNSGAGFGIALVAAAVSEGVPVEEKMNNLLFDKEKFTPQPHRAALYQKKYQKYLRIHDAVCSIEAE